MFEIREWWWEISGAFYKEDHLPEALNISNTFFSRNERKDDDAFHTKMTRRLTLKPTSSLLLLLLSQRGTTTASRRFLLRIHGSALNEIWKREKAVELRSTASQ